MHGQHYRDTKGILGTTKLPIYSSKRWGLQSDGVDDSDIRSKPSGVHQEYGGAQMCLR